MTAKTMNRHAYGFRDVGFFQLNCELKYFLVG
jgi:hypothetical protein